MQIGIIGLGRMGMNMARRWIRGGHEVIAYNRTAAKTDDLAKEGGKATYSIKEFVGALKSPRVVWLMLPAGDATDEHLKEVTELLSPNDIVVDGANNYFKDDIRHAEFLQGRNIRFLDAGVSGGIWGLNIGYCTMVGGDRTAFDYLQPLLKTLAPPEGLIYCGNHGAGHFVKMVHNGIEYGMMQAYAEGFEILKASGYNTDLKEVAHVWNRGSVVRSWLLELAENALEKDPELSEISGYVEDSGEGRWTIQQAIETGVSAPVITLSLFQRFVSRQKEPFGFRLLAALRNQFGGHAVVSSGQDVRAKDAGAGKIKPAAADPKAAPKGNAPTGDPTNIQTLKK